MDTVGTPKAIIQSRNGFGAHAILQAPHQPERYAGTGPVRGAKQLLAEARAARGGRCTFADYLRFAVVAVYLAGVMAWLLASRHLRPNFSVRRTLRALFFRGRNVYKEV
jgi:hypothetical protein